MEDKLKLIFDELWDKAYDVVSHKYEYKYANQIIRKHFDSLCPNRSKYNTFYYGWLAGLMAALIMGLMII